MERNFRQKTLQSFSVIRDDMDRFRESMNEWVIFLDGELKEEKQKVKRMEQRINELEMERRLRF